MLLNKVTEKGGKLQRKAGGNDVLWRKEWENGVDLQKFFTER